MPHELRTNRLVLRDWRDDDLSAFAALNADAEVMEHFPAVLSASESAASAASIRSEIAERGWGLWAAEVPGRIPFLGIIGLSVPSFAAPFTPCVEIAWRIARVEWGKGYATEGARAALDFAFDELHLDEIVSFTTEGNTRSRRVMERLGMQRDPRDDFDHPSLADGHPRRRHVLYRSRRG